jgi:hypothetical protein
MRTSSKRDWLIWATCSALTAALLYLLSFGPYLKFCFSGKPTPFYSPAMEFMHVPLLGRAYRHYMGWWGLRITTYDSR